MYESFMTEKPKIFIDGVDTSMFGICLSERPEIPVTNRVQATNTPAYSTRGTARTNIGWEDLNIRVRFNYLEEYEKVYKTFRQAFHEIADILHNSKKIVFNDDYNIYYLVKHVDINTAKNDMLEYGEFDVTFVCNPFGYVNDDGMGTEYRFHNIVPAPNPNRNYELLNDGADEAYPRIQLNLFTWKTDDISQNNPLTIELNWMEYSRNLPSLRNTWSLSVVKLIEGYNLIIDSENTIAYWESNSAFEDLKTYKPTLDTIQMTNFPTLYLGKSEISVNTNRQLNRELIVSIERNVIM